MPPSSQPSRWGRFLLAASAFALVLLVVGGPLHGLIVHSIVVDGDVSDWGDVLTDPENSVADSGSFSDPVDPDVPGTADRDLRAVAFTWDDTNLYFFFRRTLQGSNSFDLVVYIDLGHDGFLDDTDLIVSYSYNGSSFQTGEIYYYVPADPAGDPITDDGTDEPGTLGAQQAGAPFGADSPDGIEFETRVAWSELGVPAGTCLLIHPSIGRGLNLPGQIEDNTDRLDTQDVEPRLEDDRVASTGSPGQVDHAHRACHDGNCQDTIDLSVRTSEGWRIELWSDPNGDGDPSDGALLAVDANGDGDFSDDDLGDSIEPGADSNANGVPDTGALNGGECFDFVSRVIVPAGVADGTVDLERVRARSATRARELRRNFDETHVGAVVVYADEARSGVAGDESWLPHLACNHQGASDTLDLSATSTLGWTLEIWSDPDGDGDPSDGALISDTGLLADGECFSFVVRAFIPVGEPAGSVDAISVFGTSRIDPSRQGRADDEVEVFADAFTVTPDHDRDAGPGNTLFLPHDLRNHGSAADSYALSAVSALPGYTLTLLTDPDGDGEPDDSAEIPDGSIVGPVPGSGGLYTFLIRIDVPIGAPLGDVNTVTVTAESQASPGVTASAVDTIRIQRILTYSDPLFARPSKTFFSSCATVYTQAHGLQTNRNYRFVWTDPAAMIQRVSPSYSPDALGRADDSFSLPCGVMPGTWTIELERRAGSDWVPVAGGSTSFDTLDPAAGEGGDIIRLVTDRAVYDVDSDDVAVESTLDNDTLADYVDTVAEYVIFMDSDGDGMPSDGEPWILPDGTRGAWAAGDLTHETLDIDVLSGDQFEDFWLVQNVQFGIEGEWCVWERWAVQCTSGSCSRETIDTALTCFQVTCLPAPSADAGGDRRECEGVDVPLDEAASDGDSLQWDDGGAGGSFAPSATVLNPTYTPPGPGTFTLTLTATNSEGCDAADSLSLIVDENPVVDAGADKLTCAGDAVALDDAAGGIADDFAWDDGGAGGAFSPDAVSLNPSYTPPDPSPASITLSLTGTVTATGCDTVDSLTLTVDENPLVDAGADRTTCAGDSVALDDAAGGIADDFAWDDGGAGGTFSPDAVSLNPSYTPPDPSPASITLTLTGTVTATGCDTVDSLVLSVDENPVVDAGADKTTCAGDAVALDDAAGGIADDFAWDDGGAGGTFSPDAVSLNPSYTPPDPSPASITLTLTGTVTATGCDTVDSLVLSVDENPVVEAGADKTTCAGDSVALDDAAGGIADDFAWDDGGAGGTFSPDAVSLNPSYTPPDPSPASITLTLTGTVTATGCDTVDSLVLSVDENPVVDAGADKTTCAGDAVALDDATGGIADDFAWDDGGAGGTFSPDAVSLNPSYTPPDPSPASITLTLTGTVTATGCDTVDSLVLSVDENPVVDAGADKTTCAGDSVALDDAAGGIADDFAWDDGGAGGTFSPDAVSLNPSYTPPDPSPASITLTLTGTVTATGCDTVDSLVLSVDENPVVDAGADKTTCAGDSVALDDATGGIADDYLWDDGGAGGSFSPDAVSLNPSYTPPDPSPASITLSLTATVTATGCDTVDSLVLSVDENPVVEAGADKTSCAGDAVALDDATGGVADDFAWDDGGAGGTFSPDAVSLNPSYTPPDPSPASITLTLTGTVTATGCDTVDSLVLSVDENPVVDAGADKTTCAGDAVALDDAAGGIADDFAWDDGGAGGTFSPDAVSLNPSYTPPDPSPASITLTLTGTVTATGCDTVDSLVLSVDENPVVDAGADKTTCAGDSVALDDATGGIADDFAWDDGGAGGTFSPDAVSLNPSYTPPDPSPASITLTLTGTVTATGCDTVDSLTLTVDENPVVDAGANKETCAGDAVALDDASGGTADEYLWDDGGAGGVFDPGPDVLQPGYVNATAGAYTLTLTATDSLTGCDSVDTVSVDVAGNPTVDAGTDKSGCAGLAVELDDAFASGGTDLLWDDGGAGGSFDPGPDVLDPSYTNSVAGTYTLTLTATRPEDGCDSSDSLVVTIEAQPSADAGADKSGCAGEGVALDDATSDGDTVSWDDGGAGGSFSPSAAVLNPTYTHAAAGSYTLTLTATADGSGCEASDSLEVEVAALPTVDAGADKSSCAGDPVALDDATSDADTFSWDDGGAGGSFDPGPEVLNPSYSNPNPGEHVLTLTVTDSVSGCSASDSLTVTPSPVPVADFVVETVPVCEDTPVCFDNLSTDGTSWHWDFGTPDGDSSTDFEPCFTYSQGGMYAVTLTATNGCGEDEIIRVVEVDPKPVADFSYSTQGNRFCKNKDVNFFDESTESPTSWEWDFDDGSTSTEQNPVHEFLTDGVFIVSLVACNECGCSPPHFEAVEIAASCNTNCEANSNPIGCAEAPAVVESDTCEDHDNFNTSSYPCAPEGYDYSGENKTWDLNFLAGSNFIIRLIETEPEPNGYELDVMISRSCNPPDCVAWGDDEVFYDDRTPENDDFWVIVDGRDGTCGPYRLEVECLSPNDTGLCTGPVFDGIVDARDEDPCRISGIIVEWGAVSDWGRGPDGEPCDEGHFEIWRAPSDDPDDDRQVGTAPSDATSFLDLEAVPNREYEYRVEAVNHCCGEPTLTDARELATDEFGDPVEADAGPERTLSCDSPTATLLGSASGGTGSGYDYLWTPPDGLSDPAIPNPTVSTPGTYTLTVTDRGNGCTDEDLVVVHDDLIDPVAEAGPDAEITCDETSVTLMGSASGGNGSMGYSYSWTPAGPLDDPASPTPSTSTPGIYTLTVQDLANGCTGTDTVEVVDNDEPPIADAGPNAEITCDGPEVTLFGAASGGDGRAGYEFAWEPAEDVSDPAVAQPTTVVDGTYTLTVTDLHTGCTDTDTVVVVRNDNPPTAGAGPDRTLTCEETVVTLDGSASGGDGSAGYSYSWSPPENVSDASAEDPTTSVAGTYTLTVTDLHTGCVDEDVVEVFLDGSVPAADAGPDKLLTCEEELVTLEGSASGGDDSAGYSYAWEPAADVSDPAAAQPTTELPGTYTLTVTAIADGCSSQDVVVVEQDVASPLAEAGPQKTLTCTTTTVTLEGAASGGNGSQGYEYAWEPAGDVSDPSAAQPTTDTPGTYTLTVTDLANGCTHLDTVEVFEDVEAPVAEAGPEKTLTCATTTVTLEGAASGGNGSMGYEYAWEPAADVSDPAAPQPTTELPGTYTLTVTDLANGCADVDTVLVGEDLADPAAEAGPEKTLTCGTTMVTLEGSASGGNGSAGYEYAWEPAGDVSDPAAPQPTTDLPGTYTLTVTDLANGCTDVDTVLVGEDLADPVAEAGPEKTLTCGTTTVTLEGSASGGNGSAGYEYAWEPAGEVSDAAAPQPTTELPGTYTLTVTDLANGCTHSDTVEVLEDVAAPVAEAGPEKTLTCATTTVTLEGSASGGNGSAGYEYAWEPAGDVSDPAVPQPTTGRPGTYTLTVTDLANGCTHLDTVEVLEDVEAPVAEAGPEQTLTCTTTSVTLEGAASGGNGSAGYEYAWEPAADVSDPSAAQPTTDTPGTYTLTVTDLANGCTHLDTVEVFEDVAAPVAEAGPEKTLTCGTTTVTLEGSASGGNGSAGYDHAWEPAADVSDPSAAQPTTQVPGTYTLTVTDLANGCTHSDTVEVLEDVAAPVAEAGPEKTLTCGTTTVTLEGSASGGNGSVGYDYAWEPAADVSDPSAAQPTTQVPGTYTLTVTDLANGCTHFDTVDVLEDVAEPTASAGPEKTLTCGMTTVTLEGSASGGNGSAGYDYAWEPAGDVSDPAAPQPTTDRPGTYTLTVTDLANGCTNADTVLVGEDVAEPVAEAGPNKTLTCATTTVTLEGSASGGNGSQGYEYAWAPAGDVSDPSAAQPTTQVPGTYTLTVTDLANGCFGVDSVVVGEDVAAPVADAGPDSELGCDEPSAPLTGSAAGGNGSAGYGYRWEPAGAVVDPDAAETEALAAGTYTLTVTDLANGCTSTDTAVVRSNEEAPTADAGPDDRITCQRDTAVLRGAASGGDGSLGYQTSWSPTAGVADPGSLVTTTTEPGTYTLLVLDIATGCRSSDVMVVVDDRVPPVAEAGPLRTLTCAETSVVLLGGASGGNGSAGYRYAWEPAADVSDPAAAQPTAFAPGTYLLTVTDLANGCTDVDTVVVTEDLRAPTASAGPDRTITCAELSVVLEGAASGGNGSAGYSFAWEPAAGVSDPAAERPTTSTPGTYTLTVTDLANGCAHEDVVEVDANVAVPVAEAGPARTISCAEPTVVLSGSATGGDGSLGYSFRWSPAAGLSDRDVPDPVASRAGTWTLTVTDLANGCVSIDTVTVVEDLVEPVADAGPDGTLDCSELSVTLQGSATGGNGSAGYSYSWAPTAGLSDPTSATPEAFAGGTWTLTVRDLANGCEDSDVVVVSSDPDRPTADAGPDLVQDCDSPVVTLRASASGGDGSLGYDYSWEPAALVADPAASETTTSTQGTYLLTVTDRASGCTAQDVVVVTGPVPPLADAGPDGEWSCLMPEVALIGAASGGNGSLGYTYSWEPAADVRDPAAASTSALAPGTYVLTVTDLATGCTDTDTVDIVGVAPPLPSEPSPRDLDPAAEPLRVQWRDPFLQDLLRLTWQDTGAYADRLVEGTLAGLWTTGYDHRPIECSLPGSLGDVPAPEADAYWLALTANCEGVESSLGRDSLGAERPDAATASGLSCP